MWSTVARNLQLQQGGRIGPIVTCPSPDCINHSNPNPANPNPTNLNPTAPSPLGAVNKAPKRSGYSFLTYLTTAAATTTTTTSSAANPATTITATGSSDISFDSPFKRLSSSQHATTATAAPTPLKKGKEKALLPATLALTFSSLIDQIVILSVNNPAFKEIVEYTGLARKLALTQILKEEEKKALIFPLFVAQALRQKK
ncbi:hypothetical protein P8C59_002821 [Phyllachora maydis]|uniref:Uncharacterized protein n=1 Tax=Phyllachora maydis TaxID=1825666 RepID=A0AAD9HYZ1_9PEZI|nr:hypothetical protein P8C59_002821 [Phyllachora maydis]